MPNPKANQQPLDLDRIKADAMSMGIPARALLDMIASGARSAVATTVGLPADLANTAIGLHNMAHDIRRRKFEGYEPGTIPGGSEDIKGLIPDISKDPNSNLNKMADFGGGFTVIPGAGTAAVKGAKMIGQEIADRVATGRPLMHGAFNEPQMAMHVVQPSKLVSAVDKTAAELPRAKGTGKEFMTELSKKPGVKKAELADRNLHEINDLPKMTKDEFQAELAKRPKPIVTKKIINDEGGRLQIIPHNPDSILDDRHWVVDSNGEPVTAHPFPSRSDAESHIENHEEEDNLTRYKDYKLPGGENYQEHLYKLPGNEYKSPHWDEPNVLAHARMVDRTTPEGKKILHVEEMQSDWHQKGREHGYVDPEEKWRITKKLIRNEPLTPEEHDNYVSFQYGPKVPDAPFKKNWEEMVSKDLVKHAIDNGYDGIALTPGKEQADRYSLKHHIGEVYANPTEDGKFHLTVNKKNGDEFYDTARTGPININEIQNLVGKELAEKIASQEKEHTYSGLDLEVGGEGMKAAYDKRIPNAFNDIGKPYGAEMKLNELPVRTNGLHITEENPDKTWSVHRADPDGINYYQVSVHPTQQEANETATKLNSIPLHYMEFTPEMKQSVGTNSLPAYKKGGKVTVNEDHDMMRHELHMANGGDTESVADKVKNTVTDWGHRLSNHLVGMASDPVQYAKNLGAQTQEDLQAINDLHNQAFGDPKRPLKITDQNAFNDLASKYMNSVTNFAPIGMTKSADKIIPMLERARAKPPEEIKAIAERMAPQVIGEKFVRGNAGTTSVAGKSQKQFYREKELPIDIRPDKELPKPEIVDLAKHKGKVMVGIAGDPTMSAHTLHGVGDINLDSPSPQHGGPFYGLDKDVFWASGLSQAKNAQRVAREASQSYNAPVIGNYMKMGPDSYYYAQHLADANLQAIDPTKMTDAQKALLNADIRAGGPMSKNKPIPYFDTFENKGDAYMQMQMNPALRKHFNWLVMKPTSAEKYGIPSGLDIAHAITVPELANLETGATGASMGEMKPFDPLTLSSHPTYSHDIPGQFLGSSKYPIPYELMFPDSLQTVKNNPIQAPQEFGSLKMIGPRQTIDQQLIDEIGQYQDAMKSLTGKKKGGAVHMAGGGSLVNKIAERLGQKIVSKAESEANLGKLLSESQIQNPVYHATYSNFKIPTVNHGQQEYRKFGIHVGTPEAANSRLELKKNEDAIQHEKSGNAEANIMPVYVNVKNPLRLDENRTGRWGVDDIMKSIMEKADRGELPQVPSHHVDDYMNDTFHIEGALGTKPEAGDHNYDPNEPVRFWSDHYEFEPGERSEMLKNYIKQMGHDSIVYNNEFEGGGDSHILLDPNQMKSAIGNQGTYDPNLRDIGRRKGGSVHVSNDLNMIRHELNTRG